MTVERPVAELRLHGERRVFVATDCRIESSLVHVSGKWQQRVGLNYSELHWSGPRVYTFPVAAIRQVRWLLEESET